jgi:hypothetical protein
VRKVEYKKIKTITMRLLILLMWSSVNSKELYFIESKKVCDKEWNAREYVGKGEYINETSIRVVYPKGSYKSPKNGGFQYTSKPQKPSDSIEIGYKIYIPDDFDYVKGGKLPGVYAGVPLSGGNKKGVGIEGISLRLMFRESGYMEVYGYIPNTDSKSSGGVSLMRGKSKLQSGINDIRLYASMNKDCKDGVVELSVNGKKNRIDDIILRLDDRLKFEGIFFSTFFGGNSREYATPKRQEVVFSSFWIKNEKKIL